jgi:hypothetical protein
LLCEPHETTANGKRLVVEDSAACQKTIQTPASQQVLKTDGASNLTWTNGANNTVLAKSSTGVVEFATINSVLQAAPVDLGSQPLTTTGTISASSVSGGAITATSVTATGPVSVTSLSASGAATIAGVPKLTGLSVYASNAAAVSGGLAVNSVYKTATGELRIVV